MHIHVALRLLQGLSVLLLRWFLLNIRIVEKELIVVELIEIEDGLFATYMLPIFWYFIHLFIAVGDHPDKLGSQITKAIRGVETADGAPWCEVQQVLLGVVESS